MIGGFSLYLPSNVGVLSDHSQLFNKKHWKSQSVISNTEEQ